MICASCGQHSATSPCDGCDQEPRLDGRFALQAVLGQGSFGTTWRALDATGTPVALKEMLLRPELQERVERELRVLRQLDHPGVPHYIEDFRTRAGRYASQVLVMELIDGQTITQELEERRFGALDVVELVQELAGILVYLHGLSPPVIHRDIKPANVMRRATGGLVLIDFGLVRDTVIATLGGTREVGTIGYQAPEQFAGDPIPASDLYALGAVAVRLLTRREPHELVRALYEPMRWRKHASVPDEVAALIDALVAPEPGDRVGSAAELARWCASLRRGDRSRQAIQQVQHGPATPAEDEVAEGEASHAAPEPAPEESAASRAPPLSGARFASIRPPVRKLPSETYRLAEVDLTMLRVEPGAFEMGSAAGQRGRSDEETMHLVTLEQPFMLGRAPMCQELIHALGGQPRDRRHDPRLPAQSVSWSDAVEICNQLSEMAGLRPAYHREVLAAAKPGLWGLGARPERQAWRWDRDADGFRLPTEAEWEYAARAMGTQPWAGSNRADDVAWHKGNAQGHTQPVELLLPNAWGLYDMSGNIWEWCWDWYHSYDTQQPVDPQGPDTGTYRVIRGGCAKYHVHYARVARRGGRKPERCYSYVGMRLARSCS